MTGIPMADKELIQLVAAAAAGEAAKEIVIETRAEIAEQFDSLKSDMRLELDSRFTSYFGRLEPSEHIIHHDRVRRGTKWFDDTMGSFFGKVVIAAIVIAIVLSVGSPVISHLTALVGVK